MSSVGTRKSVVDVAKRNYTVSCASRSFTSQVAKRTYLTGVPKRDFGVIISGWRLWGQTDIHPFDYPSGVDSTKTFGELP